MLRLMLLRAPATLIPAQIYVPASKGLIVLVCMRICREWREWLHTNGDMHHSCDRIVTAHGVWLLLQPPVFLTYTPLNRCLFLDAVVCCCSKILRM